MKGSMCLRACARVCLYQCECAWLKNMVSILKLRWIITSVSTSNCYNISHVSLEWFEILCYYCLSKDVSVICIYMCVCVSSCVCRCVCSCVCVYQPAGYLMCIVSIICFNKLFCIVSSPWMIKFCLGEWVGNLIVC